jgi:hypothetical protein
LIPLFLALDSCPPFQIGDGFSLRHSPSQDHQVDNIPGSAALVALEALIEDRKVWRLPPTGLTFRTEEALPSPMKAKIDGDFSPATGGLQAGDMVPEGGVIHAAQPYPLWRGVF